MLRKRIEKNPDVNITQVVANNKSSQNAVQIFYSSYFLQLQLTIEIILHETKFTFRAHKRTTSISIWSATVF